MGKILDLFKQPITFEWKQIRIPRENLEYEETTIYNLTLKKKQLEREIEELEYKKRILLR